jgi:hypothetical protein
MEPFAIHIGSFILSEPVTAVSDLLLSAFCISRVIVFQKYRSPDSALSFWQLFFLLMGVSSSVGVIVHGLRFYQSETVHYNTWMGMSVISGIAIYFAQMATSRSILRESKNGTLLRIIAQVQVVLFLILMILFRNYNVVKIQVAAGMVPVMIIHFYAFRKGMIGSAWLATGIAVSFFSAVVHTLKLSIDDRWFNFNDVSHVFIGTSFALISYGIIIRQKAELAEKAIPITE